MEISSLPLKKTYKYTKMKKLKNSMQLLETRYKDGDLIDVMKVYRTLGKSRYFFLGPHLVYFHLN